MTLTLFLALIAFLAPHVIPSVPGLKPALIEKMGRAGYLIAYIILSAVTFIWLIIEALRAPYTPLWGLEAWQVYTTLLFVFLACVLIVGSLITPNPLSLSVRKVDPAIPLPATLRYTRHPLLWGLGFWGASHVLVNGDLAAVLMFGILTLFAIGYIPIMDKRMRLKLGDEDWHRLCQEAKKHNLDPYLILSIGLGFVLFITLLMLHESIIGVSPVGMLG